MHWEYHNLVEATVSAFISARVPDALPAGELVYRITDAIPDAAGLHAWALEVEIPTSNSLSPVSLHFVIAEWGTDSARIRDLVAYRPNLDDVDDSLLRYTENDGWRILPADDEM